MVRDLGSTPTGNPGGIADILQGYGMRPSALAGLAAGLDAADRQRPAIAPRTAEDGAVEVGALRFTPTGLQFSDDLSQDAWQAVGEFFRQTRSALQWWIGDWINAADAQWGETYTLAAQSTGLKESYLRNVASVAGRVDLSLRRDKLSFSHYHELVNRVPEEHWANWIDYALENGLSKRKLIEAITRSETDEKQTISGGSGATNSREYRKRFNRVWRAVQAGKLPAERDIEALKVWLAEIESAVKGTPNDR